jgi:nitronate monooxygenase
MHVDRAFLDRLELAGPIIQAPMSGGPSTSALAAAVSEAGGLGSLGAAYLSPDQLRDAIRETRQGTTRAFQVNLFAGGYRTIPSFDAGPMLELLGEVHRRLGIDPPQLPPAPRDLFPDQLEVVLECAPPVFSFTFGVPSPQDLHRLRRRGILILGTATTADEARILRDAGVDGIIAQGGEAGGHRGTFARSFQQALVPTLTLVQAIRAEVEIPVIASGGLMTGADIAAALASGASAAELGTAFLATPESGASPVYKDAVLGAGDRPTAITRAFSGRPARGLVNEWMRRVAEHEEWILPYPLQNALTRAMRNAAARHGVPDYLSLWAGTGVSQARARPAGELTRILDEEYRTATP